MDIVVMLDELAEKQREFDARRAVYNKAREAILAQVKDQLDALDATFIPITEADNAHIGELTSEIKVAVLEFGRSFKANTLHAVYSRGRVTWDSKKLDGLMIALPQLSEARKEGEPSVTIRPVKEA